MKEDKILVASAEDRMNQCEECYMITHTDFLDLHQKTLVHNMIKNTPHSVKTVFFGGYEDSERTVCFFLPDYAEIEDAEDLAVARISVPGEGRKLTHRDYLGSLLATGIKREKTGDILVRPDGADIIIMRDLAEFIEMNFVKAGNVPLSVTISELDSLVIPEHNFTEREDTVASLRLDNVISSAFGISRAKASQAISRGIVFVNSLECTKQDREIHEGDKLVLRGKGKAYLMEKGGLSRKGRIYIKLRIY